MNNKPSNALPFLLSAGLHICLLVVIFIFISRKNPARDFELDHFEFLPLVTMFEQGEPGEDFVDSGKIGDFQEKILETPEVEAYQSYPSEIEQKNNSIDQIALQDSQAEHQIEPDEVQEKIPENIAQAENKILNAVEPENVSSEEKHDTPVENVFVKAQKALASLNKAEASSGGKFVKVDGYEFAGTEKYSYSKRVTEQILSACKIMRSKLKSACESSEFELGSVGLFIEIDEDGSLANLDLVSSSGNKEFDSIVLKTIKYAAPFPRIPKHLNVKRFVVSGNYHL